MTAHQIVYLVFGVVLVVALILDLGLLSKKNTTITIQKALYQTFFWVSLALLFFVFLLIEGHALSMENTKSTLSEEAASSQLALEFISAYLMEWSLSIDNIFVQKRQILDYG
jgi:tellurite resistance protein TerC